uniref:Uncharacterized protein n=1 Tax=Gadus morhua TaxID=8049 RepID=A0A8C5BSH7_GADMO
MFDSNGVGGSCNKEMTCVDVLPDQRVRHIPECQSTVKTSTTDMVLTWAWSCRNATLSAPPSAAPGGGARPPWSCTGTCRTGSATPGRAPRERRPLQAERGTHAVGIHDAEPRS